MGVIFDLDQTLIDSSIAEAYRKSRQWKSVYSLIPQFTQYNGVDEALLFLHENNIPVCIVTSSISDYCNKVLSHWKFNVSNKVCYHDTSNRKPHPAPILKAVSLIKSVPYKTLSFGDRDIDIEASNSAKVVSVACLWGAEDPTSLTRANPAFTLSKPHDMIPLFKSHFNIS